MLLALLGAAHFVVDVVATTVNPLWPYLERHHALEEGGLLWGFVVWSISTSFTQFLFGYFGDRFRGRWLLWTGPLVAIVCLSCIGIAGSPFTLGLLLVVAGLGVAAFHPEGAATAGSLAAHHRSRVMAIFALGGYLGQSIGPAYAGMLTDRFGPSGLLWTAVWALPLMLLIGCGLGCFPSYGAAVHRERQSGTVTVGQTRTLILLLAIGTLRIMPALGIPLTLAYLLGAREAVNTEIGFVQGTFMAGIGLGGVLCALAVRRNWERTILWLLPTVATPFVFCLSFTTGGAMKWCVFAVGFFLGIAMPVYISYGQQLLPHRQRMASSITMGVSWGLSGAAVAAAVRCFQVWSALEATFVLFAATCAASGLLCRWLPSPKH
jgi:FSR family fosmidomycin resistance protein-like MFS transporter